MKGLWIVFSTLRSDRKRSLFSREVLVVVSLLVTLTLAGCGGPLPPRPPPPDPEGLGTPLGDLCVHLRDLGCPEGQPAPSGKTCYQELRVRSKLLAIPTQCLAEAPDVDAIRACGGSEELHFRCEVAPARAAPLAGDAGT